MSLSFSLSLDSAVYVGTLFARETRQSRSILIMKGFAFARLLPSTLSHHNKCKTFLKTDIHHKAKIIHLSHL